MALAATHDDKPLSTILLFAVDNDFNFYFATRSETYKAKALEKNPKVSLSIWEHKKFLIQVDGLAKKIEKEEEINSTLDLLVSATENIKDFWPPVVRSRSKGDYVVFKIKPNWLRALDLELESIAEDKTPFIEIEI